MTEAQTAERKQHLSLGLDTGGTYTDAVILDFNKKIIATAKSLTTKHDLSIGLADAIQAVINKLSAPYSPSDINLVSVSTTLATNAVVENQRAPICAILIGYEPKMLQRAGLQQALGTSAVALIGGGHHANGDEKEPLDLEAARATILENADKVEAFAISSMFSVRNPSHETKVRALVHELTHKSVTCGHELTSGLDAPRRALTAALNAQLTPQIRHLIEAVQKVLATIGVDASLMIVKGDGSLMEAKIALQCPVETILSGPAASVVGAKFLTGKTDFVVSDMGGTTTDIAVVQGGNPVLSSNGALVGGWNTMVQAVDVRTYGLGGDSEISVDEDGKLTIGPRRVIPLSLLIKMFPGMMNKLISQMNMEVPPLYPGKFAFRQMPNANVSNQSQAAQHVWEALANGPKPLFEIARSASQMRALRALISQGLVAASGMTPSDAMHVLGHQNDWDKKAAELGAALLFRDYNEWYMQPTPQQVLDLCTELQERVIRQIGRVICETAFGQEPGIRPGTSGGWGQLGDALVENTVKGVAFSKLVDVTLRFNSSLIAIGAPVRSYYPEVSKRLNSDLVIPDHADVTNAIGAVAGVVMQTVEILVTQMTLKVFRLHDPAGQQDFTDAEEAISRAKEIAEKLASDAALKAGAATVTIETTVAKKTAKQKDGGDFMAEAVIRSTATGRPSVSDS